MKIADLYSSKKGKKPGELRDSNLDDDIRFIQIGDLRNDSAIKYCASLEGLEGQVICNEDDILIAWDGAYSGLVACGLSGAFGSTIARLRPITENAFTPYSTRFLQSQFAEIQRNRTGATIPHISGQHLRQIKIPLPPLDEQKRIAAILDAADELRTKRRDAIEQLDELLQATFLHLFGDPVSNPKGWEVVEFGDLIEEGPKNGIYKPATNYGSGTRILRIDGFYDGEVTDVLSLRRVRIKNGEISTYGLKKGDIVINRVNSRSHLGKCALIPKLTEPVVFESNMMRTTINDSLMLPIVAVHYLLTKHVKNQILSAAKDAVNQSSINQTDVRALEFRLPPLPLQQEFANIVSTIEKQKARHRAQLDELDTLFAALQSRAFKGEL